MDKLRKIVIVEVTFFFKVFILNYAQYNIKIDPKSYTLVSICNIDCKKKKNWILLDARYQVY
jgi:hypothetical protein